MRKFLLFVVVACLSGCAHHPVDCAMGFAWSDCLPGTAGYNNGGGEQPRAEQSNKEFTSISAQFQAAFVQCKADMQLAELDPLRTKVELVRDSFDTAPPFEIASNDTFPIEAERAIIARWATIREGCIKREEAISELPPSATQLQVSFLQQDRAFAREAAGRVGQLIVALYQQKLTFGEFAQKRYEITRAAKSAEREFRRSTQLADQQRQMQAQQLAQQQFQNNLIAWSAYMQSVSARQAQTVHLDGSLRVHTNCTSQQVGNFVSTNCN